MFDIFKKKDSPSWKSLSETLKRQVATKIIKTLKNMAGPRYKIVTGMDQYNREQFMIETQKEDYYLNFTNRSKIKDGILNSLRNGPTLNSLLKQFDLNVVGTKGGKVLFDFGDEGFKKAFKKWTRNAGFWGAESFNQLLKQILREYLTMGDMVLMFDDGLVEDSGKLLCYSSDMINNSTEEALAKNFGRGCSLHLGRVENANGRWVGTIVSRSCIGQETVPEDKCYFLHRDPNAEDLEQLWIMPRNIFRMTGQGRGISTAMTSTLGAIQDLDSTVEYEILAAKKNSQTVGQIIQTGEDAVEEAEVPSAFDADTDFENMSDEEIAEAVKEESVAEEQVVSLDKIRASGVIFEAMPKNYKMELLDTKHPNDRMADFIDWLQSRCYGPFALTKQYATLTTDSSTFKTQQMMVTPVFEECLKFLESICDWVLVRFYVWAKRKGIVDTTLEDDWIEDVKWCWTRQEDIDFNAVDTKLKNMTLSYKDIFGNNWREHLEQVKEEVEYCKQNNLPSPVYSMISGGERTGADEYVSEEDNAE